MQWTGLNELREKYLSFFEGKGHLRLGSFPLVPKDDPSLLLINSGMAPMKKWFLGQEEPPRHRVTTCQKCIRTPDIERVGITARHGTFFEMLGNFSFQDYFKKEVIPWAWEFLTSDAWMAIPKDKLYISVYLDDDEAYDIWTKEVGIAPDHMVRMGKEDTFWEHGSGPCGPCSEIYFDRGPEYGCGKPTCGPGCDCDRYMEIWNLVFSQFDSDGKGHYDRLPKPNIDTGMGLERLACVMQNVGNLFEVDTVQSVLHHVEHIAGKSYKQDDKADISIRVITDHIRSCTFMVSDGILPSNEGRGYVLRRLLRRAARHGRLLGIQGPFLVDLVETVIQSSESAYPELREHAAYIKKVVGTEEANFARTIDAGMNILNTMIDELEKEGIKTLGGADVFKLNDTFGFPLDLTKEIAAEQGIEVDEDGFHAEMTKQKERARAERLKKNISGWSADLFGSLDAAPTVFTGYDTLTDQGTVVALSDEENLTDGISTDDQAKEDVLVVLDKTPFYAEMGGQVAGPRHPHRRELHPEGAGRQEDPQGLLRPHLRAGKRLCPCGRRADRPGGPRVPLGHRPQPHRHPPAAGCPAGSAGRPCPPGRLLPGCPREPTLTSPTSAPSPPRNWPRWRRSSTTRSTTPWRSTSRACLWRRPRRRAPWPCSVRSTARSSGLWTSAAGPPSSAAAPTSRTPPRSAASRLSASPLWPPASAASRPSPARTCCCGPTPPSRCCATPPLP